MLNEKRSQLIKNAAERIAQGYRDAVIPMYGDALHAATVLAKRPENKGKTIVALLPDGGDKYLSTPMYQEG